MRSRNRRDRHRSSELPEINLVPMMDVLMTILTFFIIISMSLTGQQLLSINLPQSTAEESEQDPEEEAPQQKLVVGLSDKGQAFIGKQHITQDGLAKQVGDFLTENPEGVVMLKADRRLDFKAVADLLRTLRDIGGDRVLLGIEQPTEPAAS
ncbi:MAG: biopolymer transporter ExbD [Timaviella obliquedivisa GSE-PSE-MK23-08B]|jgi:biopolymer transport protein ExbD|nr:biopolymer transporter ExbD [Timaviella obliquedivisa GSE-PSE-MK23-08B]